MICARCNRPAKLVAGTVVYPHRQDLADRLFWLCADCDAWVGCHEGTETPMGTLADAATRAARRHAHTMFDALWRGKEARSAAYAWMAAKLAIPIKDCHIGQMSLATCNRVMKICQEAGGRF